MLLRSFVLSIIALSLTACNISGLGEKGPFKAGSTVTISKLDDQANPLSGLSVSTQTKTKQGFFSTNSVNWNGWTEVQVTGLYFDEYSNSDSTASMSLNAITKKDRIFDIANVNLFTHLASARIKQQVANGETTYDAWKSTQVELKQLFGLSKVGLSIHRGVEQLSLSRGSGRFRQDNANLLLFTGSFLATGGNATSLQTLSNDFADDGQFNGAGESTFNAIASKASTGWLLTTLSRNLKNHGARNPPNNGDMPELPVWVSDDGEVSDTTAPIISVGSLTVSIPEGTSFTDDVTANDNTDGDISSKIITTGDTLNTNIVGVYTLVYNVSDTAGNSAEQITRTITVTDATPPVLHIGSTDVSLFVGDSFIDDVSATDNIDNDGEISGKIEISGDTLSTAVSGVYELKYNVTDNAGNHAIEVTRTVTVILKPDTTAPIITVNPTEVTVEVNTSYDDNGVSAEDDRDGSVSVTSNASQVVDVTIIGEYEVTYTAKDSANNQAVVATRLVKVEDTTPPVFDTNSLSDITVDEGSSYDALAGVSASDNSGLIVSIVVTNNPVDTSIPGTYTVVYKATDTVGNFVTATRTVIVKATEILPLSVIGSVIKADGTVINGAQISIYKDGVLLNPIPEISGPNGDGAYSLGLNVDSDYTLIFKHDDYATQVNNFSAINTPIFTLDIIMAPTESALPFNPSNEFIATSSTDNSTEVAIPADAFAIANIEAVITTLNLNTQDGIDGIPGNEKGLFDGETEPSSLMLLGLAEFSFFDSDSITKEEAQLEPNKTAQITIPIYNSIRADGSPLIADDVVPLLYLDETTGVWMQDQDLNGNAINAVVIDDLSSPSLLSATAEVNHFTWFSTGYSLPPGTPLVKTVQITLHSGGEPFQLTDYAIIRSYTTTDQIFSGSIDVAVNIFGTITAEFPNVGDGESCFWAEIYLSGAITPITSQTECVSVSGPTILLNHGINLFYPSSGFSDFTFKSSNSLLWQDNSAVQTNPLMNFADAQTYCTSLNAASFGGWGTGWRLPTTFDYRLAHYAVSLNAKWNTENLLSNPQERYWAKGDGFLDGQPDIDPFVVSSIDLGGLQQPYTYTISPVPATSLLGVRCVRGLFD